MTNDSKFQLPYFAISLALLCALSLSQSAQAQTLTVLHNFTGGADGGYGGSGLTMDRAGNFYGTTSGGGEHGEGVVYRLSRAGSGWILTSLYSFNYEANLSDGAFPYSGVVIGPDGSLYGTTYEGGRYDHGTVYRLQPPPTECHSVSCPWQETVLHSFCSQSGCLDGQDPGLGNLIFDRDGNLYGTTVTGGSEGFGVVFELTPGSGGWTESIVWNFIHYYQRYEGQNPWSGVIFDNAGNLYGTTYQDGADDSGVVYELSPSASGWTEQVLSSVYFPSTSTFGGVVMDGQGNLFGTSGCDSLGDPGGIFELTPNNGSWTFDALYSYSGSGHSGPCDTPTLDSAGNVYGTSTETGLYNDGEVFKLTPSNGGWTYTSVSFNGSNGSHPGSGVVLDSAGNIYGTAGSGGAYGYGTVWELTP